MKRKLTFMILAMLFALLSTNLAWGEDYTNEEISFTSSTLKTGWTTNGTFNSSYYKMTTGQYAQGTSTALFGTDVLSTDMTINIACGTFGTWTGNKSVKVKAIFYDSKNIELTSVEKTYTGLNSTQGTYRGEMTLSKPSNPSEIAYLKIIFSDFTTGNTLRFAGVKLTYSTQTAGPTKILTSIAISGTPTKTIYEAGEEFDPAGLVVTGTYDDESTAEITSGITWDVTPNPLTAGTTSVSVTATVDEIESEPFEVTGLTVNEFVQTYANTYTSDASLSSVITGSKVKWEGCKEPNGYNALKIARAGTATITVPAGTKTVHLHMVAWNGESDAVTVKLGSTTLPSITPTADAGVSGSSTTYTIATEPKTENSYYFPIEVNTDEEATLSLTTASSKRAILFGVNFEADTEPSITADVEEIEFEQKELDGTVTDSKVISATGKNLTAPISASMKDGSAAVFSVVANGTPTAAAGEFTVSYSTTEAGEYAGTVVLSSGEASVEIPVSVNVVAHIPVLQSIAVSGTPDKTEYTEGDAFETAGLVVTGTYDVGDPQIITEGIEWTVTPSGALAANVTSVSVVATVDGVASEAFNVNITVVELPKWAKVTADKTDWSGEYLLVYEGTGDDAGKAFVWTGVDAASCNVTATITDDQIIKPATAVSLTIASMDGGYSIQVNGGENNGKYINQTKYDNGMNISDNPSANTLSYDGTNTVIAGSGASNGSHVTMRYNSTSGQDRFRYYKSGQKAVQLYEKVLNEAVTFAAPEDGSLVIKNGENPIESGTTIQNGTVLDVTFGMTPAEAYKDVAIKVTKTDGGDDVTSTVYDATKKQITMPRYAITVAVTFTKLYKISLVTAGEGTGSATMNGVTTDIYVDDETQINLVANAVAPNEFTKWSATDKILINDESAAETYASASGDGTITATFDISELLPLGTPTLSDPTNITYSGVTLNWQELANAEAYNVELLLNDETVASAVIIGETTWTPEVTLQANTTYTYTVQGVGDGITYAEDNNPKALSTVTTADYPAATLTLSENGITRDIAGKLNTPIDLPTTSTQTCEDKVFMGWSATTIDGETDTEPSLLDETYTFTNPEQPTATIYAVYAKETPGESSNWEITSIDKPGTGTGYAAYNGSHTTNNISYTTSQIMMSNDNKIQFQKNAGYMYNTTPFSGDILFITIADITSNISVYEGSTEIATTPTSGAITLAEGKYTFSKGKKYFHIKMGNATGYSSKITVAVAGAPTYSNYCTTTPIVISENIAWDNDVTINGNTVTIGSGAVLTVKGALTNTNAANLVIEDGAQLIVNNTGVQATMKKDITSSTASKESNVNWFTISSPLATNTAFANVTGLIPTTVTALDYDLYRLDEENGIWVNSKVYDTDGQTIIANKDFTTIDKGVGYIYHNTKDTELAFAGEINVAPAKCTLTNNKTKGFNLIGNPFAQNIKLSDVKAETAVLAKGFYVLTNQNTWEAKTETDEILTKQGFLVQATTAGTATISKPTAAPSKGERSEQNTNIEMIVSNSIYRDNAFAMFGEGIGLNKVNHRNTEAPMLYVPQDGEDFAIAFMDENTTVFPVSFKAMTTGKYSISLKATDDVNTLVLIDNMTGEETNMLLEESYSFVGSPADNAGRFTVKLSISHNNGQADNEHFVYQNGSELVVNGEGTLQVFDVLGRVVISEEVHGQTVNVGGLSKGAYIVRMTGNEVKTQKIIVR